MAERYEIRDQILRLLKEFDWSDFGLDEVDAPESDDWAEYLAIHIAEELILYDD